MEEESYILPKMWDSLYFRKMGVDSMDEMGVLMCDAESNQCTITIHAQHEDSPSSRHKAYNDHLDKNNATNCQLVRACTVIEGENLKPMLLRVHKGVLIDDENQRESMLHSH